MTEGKHQLTTAPALRSYALHWTVYLILGWGLTTLAALAALVSGEHKTATALLCTQFFLIGLMISKILEIRYLWRGEAGNARSESIANMPGLAGLVATLSAGYWLVV